MTSSTFPIEKTQTGDAATRFRLEDPADRKRYYELKVGKEIEALKVYLEKNTFVAFLLGKKNSGKGTYSKLFIEAVGSERIAHISIGDVVRDAYKQLQDPKTKKAFQEAFQSKYRGFVPFSDVVEIVLGHNQKSLLPTEAILALVEIAIDRIGNKAIFVDGFPRSLDQVSLSLYFRALMGYRADPDFFIFISIPESVIDERMKSRVVCPVCQTPRSLKLFRTKRIGYDEKSKEFYLICDTPTCKGARMIPKVGDDQGIESIRERIKTDHDVMRTLLDLHGVPKVYLRNTVPVNKAKEFIDDYEVTPAYDYQRNESTGEISVIEKPWTVRDDEGIESYSLLAPTVSVSLIRQIAAILLEKE